MMQTIQILAIVALLACFEYAMSRSSVCEKFDSNMGATFDLTALKRDNSQPSFIVEDGDIPCTTKVEQNYTYVYNVCGAVTGALPKKCAGIAGVNSAGALQVDRRGTETTDDDYCYLVGSYDPNSYTMKLLDGEDPTKGIELTYYGSNCNNGVQRSFHIQMPCADKLMAVPTHAQELTGCSYTIQMPSVYGCPVECPVSYGALCAANGHCAYDETKGGARCFCNKGYTGGDCSQKATDTSTLNYSPALLGLIITLFIIIVGLAGSIVYMVRQISAYKEDMANYQTLQSSHGMGHEDSAVV